jgi:hypothetical protein
MQVWGIQALTGHGLKPLWRPKRNCSDAALAHLPGRADGSVEVSLQMVATGLGKPAYLGRQPGLRYGMFQVPLGPSVATCQQRCAGQCVPRPSQQGLAKLCTRTAPLQRAACQGARRSSVATLLQCRSLQGQQLCAGRVVSHAFRVDPTKGLPVASQPQGARALW